MSTLGSKTSRDLGRQTVSLDMRDFAGAVPTLQDARHVADYDPAGRFLVREAAALVNLAAFAIDAFNRADPTEKADVLALMVAGARG